MIQVEALVYHAPRSGKCLLKASQLHLQAGLFHGVIGPNGAGKSTLLRCLAGDLPEAEGSIVIAKRDLDSYSLSDLALTRAVLPQTTALPFAMSVAEIVSFGRDVFRNHAAKQYDQAVVAEVMEWLAIRHLAQRNYQQLSGGEQHRTQIARAFVQLIASPGVSLDDKLLFLDEPTNHLDIRHQYALMARLHELIARGLTVVCVLHDLALALNHADQIVLLDQGQAGAPLTPAELVASPVLNEVYETELNAHWSSTYQCYLVIPDDQNPLNRPQ